MGGYRTGWAQYNITPMYEYKGYAYIARARRCPSRLPQYIDDGHASHDNWRLYATSL